MKRPFSPAKPVRVLVVDDHAVVRLGVISSLAGHSHLIIVGEAQDGVEAIAKAQELSPDIVLMDIQMPNLDGLSATEALCRENPRIKVLVFTVHTSEELALRIFKSGACGHLSKKASPAKLVRAIETAVADAGVVDSDGVELPEVTEGRQLTRKG